MFSFKIKAKNQYRFFILAIVIHTENLTIQEKVAFIEYKVFIITKHGIVENSLDISFWL